jgi:hypothetical protein
MCGGIALQKRITMISISTSAARPPIAQPPQGRPINQHRSRRVTAGISPAHIAAVKAASPIVDVVGQHIDLRRQGAIFYGNCPWHSSKSARSFQVSPEHGTWRCWAGCGNGDVFAFVRKIFNSSFPDAVAYLARRAGIDLGAEIPAQVSVAFSHAQELKEINQKVRAAERAELQRIAGELADARRLHRVAGARLAQIERGATVRFIDEAALCVEALALAQEELRDLDAAYCVLAFAKDELRERFVARPEDRTTIITEILAVGFVATEKGFRHRVAVQ